MRQLIANRLVHSLVIIAVGLAVYANTVNYPFVFDDILYVLKNPLIKDFQYFGDTSKADNAVMNKNIRNLFRTRVVGHFTLALNYRYGGLDPTGYHVFNILAHLANALLVYWLVLLLLRTPFFGPRNASEDLNRMAALLVSLLFAAHPVQTGAVTFITQRFTSLATLFYILSFAAYLKWRLSEEPAAAPVKRFSSGLFYVLSVVSAIVAMKTKEISFTLPLMIAACEFMFFEGRAKQRLVRLIPHALTMFIIPFTVLRSANSAVEITRMGDSAAGSANVVSGYLFTQFRVIVTYIRLLFVPVNQNLDYDYPVYKTFFAPEVYLSFLFLALVAGAAVFIFFLSAKREQPGRGWLRLSAFGTLWFFAALSVESSFIPLLDVIFEHRLYLPSIGFFIAAVSGVMLLKTKAKRIKYSDEVIAALLIAVVMALSAAAYERNLIWRDEERLWRDVLEKSPGKVRPRFNLANYYDAQGLTDKALEEYRGILRIDPNCVEVHTNIGALYHNQGRIDEAIAEYKAALSASPDFAAAHNNLGAAYEAQGRLEEALKEFYAAIRLDPNLTTAQDNFLRVESAMKKRR